VFFIKSGRVLLKASNNIVFRAYPSGMYFGEIEVLENTARTSTAQVSSKPSDLLTLSKNDLQLIFSEFPSIGFEISNLAQERKQINEESMSHVLQLHVSENEPEKDNSLISESMSEPEEEMSANERGMWLFRRDTGVMVSSMTVSPNKVKNITTWSKAAEKREKSKTIFERDGLIFLNERKKSMKKQASLKSKLAKYPLLKSGKAMKVVEEERKIVEIEDDWKVEDKEEEGKDRVIEMQINGLLDEVNRINSKLVNEATNSLLMIHRIRAGLEDMSGDLNRLEEIVNL
jgi:hypothetical protein